MRVSIGIILGTLLTFGTLIHADESCKVVGEEAVRPTSVSPVVAADVAGRYSLEKAESKMEFCVSHFPFSTVHGTFLEFDGGFTIPPHALEESQVKVTIRPGSVDTRNDQIDSLVTGEDFFDVQKFPEITFVSTRIDLTSEKTARLSGDLTLRGVTKPVSFDVTYEFVGTDLQAQSPLVRFKANLEISRSEFGMDSLSSVVSDTVKICLGVEARRQEYRESLPKLSGATPSPRIAQELPPSAR